MKYLVASVPEREHIVEELSAEINGLIVIKDRIRSYKETHVRMFREASGDSAVFMEDDIILASNFTEKIEAVISKRETDIIQFFSRRKKDKKIGSRYDNSFSFCCCYYFPRERIEQYLSFVPVYMGRNDPQSRSKSGCDLMLNSFMREYGIKYWINVPSLVQHRDIKSSIDKRRSTKRQSETFQS